MAQAPQHRLQIATRIHHVLLRELGQGIDVERMLKQERYARDVLLVCDACRDTELPRLATDFRGAAKAMPAVAPAPGRAAQPMDWSANTSGFGVEPTRVDMHRPVGREPEAQPSWWQRLLPR
jgi:hypothetical protein